MTDSTDTSETKATPKPKPNRKGKPKAKVTKPKRPFPRRTLKEALVIPTKIKELNGGNPWTPDQLAKAVGKGARTNDFYYLTTASRDYGLTEGHSRVDSVSIATLGSEILYAANPEVEAARKRDAFLQVDIFRSVLEHYNGSKLPEMKYLGNTLEREFGLPPQFHEEFSQLFRENCDFLDISEGAAPSQSPDTQPVASPTVVVGESGRTGKKLKAFVIMPFTEKNPDRPKGFFSEVLRSLITPAGVDAGFQVETASKQGSDLIQSTIINELLEADLVVADLTDHNPNVLFELGVRMAEDRPVALIRATGTGPIFDVDNMLRVYEYNRCLWPSTVETDLPKLIEHIKAAWDSRESDQSYMKILRRDQ
jgi:hypothetical protein